MHLAERLRQWRQPEMRPSHLIWSEWAGGGQRRDEHVWAFSERGTCPSPATLVASAEARVLELGPGGSGRGRGGGGGGDVHHNTADDRQGQRGGEGRGW